ncbi:hypothetical protein KHP62_12005 [Rhodobacteraceae bacterium NNCM2]|nr:hypothetical protein [Coraliihabitans acroporae]
MALQNRVIPTGEIVSQPWRGALMGNRGCLHDGANRLGRARWRHPNWVCCVTQFRGRHREVMPPPGSPTVYTALFFWDEASAFAAGHRPCGQCRYGDYQRFMACWERAGLPRRGAKAVDRHLHARRVGKDRAQVRFWADAASLPPGTFIHVGGEPVLLDQASAWRWSPQGYAPVDRPASGEVEVLTPAPIVEVFRAGYRPEMRSA